MFRTLFKIARPVNLVIVVATAVCCRFGFGFHAAPARFTEHLTFWGMTLIAVLLTAGGNLINDYFDYRVDRINRPDEVLVEKVIKRRVVIVSHLILTAIALGLSLGISHFHRSLFPLIGTISFALALIIYSPMLKKKALVGNLMVAICTAFIPYWASWPLHLSVMDIFHFGTTAYWVFLFSAFAFTSTMAREIVKDIEDMAGDQLEHYRTLPIVLGIPTAKIYAILFLIANVVLVMLSVLGAHTINWNEPQFFKPEFPHYYTLMAAVGMIIPLLVSAIFIALDSRKSSYHRASQLIKWSMATGIFCAFLLRFLFY